MSDDHALDQRNHLKPLKKAGWWLIAISAVVIFYNAVMVRRYNERKMENHPIETVLTFGSNLKNRYTFLPPYTGFEVLIIGLGIAGIALVVAGRNQESK